MPVLDPVENFAKTELASGILAGAVSMSVLAGTASLFPDPAVDGNFNVVIYNSTDFNNPSDDPDREIVRITAVLGDSFNITRGQEGTIAVDHNTAGKTYTVAEVLTKKVLLDIIAQLGLKLSSVSHDTTLGGLGTPGSPLSVIGGGGGGGGGGGTKIEIDTTDTVITGTTTPFTVSIPAGILDVNNAIKFAVAFSNVAVDVGETITIVVKYGGSVIGTVILDGSSDSILSTNAILTGFLMADGATNAQKSIISVVSKVDSNDNVPVDTNTGTSAVDSTSSQDLEIICTISGGSTTMTAEAIVVEAINGTGGGSLSTISGIAGQDLALRDAVFKANGEEIKCLGSQTTGSSLHTYSGAVTKYFGTIFEIPFECNFDQLVIGIGFPRSGTWTIQLRDVVGGAIGNTVIATTNVVVGVNSSGAPYFLELTGLGLTPSQGDKYAIVSKWQGSAPGSNIDFPVVTTVDDSNQSTFTSPDGTTWSALVGTIMPACPILNLIPNKIYQTDVDMYNSKFEGLAQSAVSLGDPVTATTKGSFTTAGLTADSKYYVSNTPGAIDKTSTENEFVGIATSTTSIEVNLGYNKNLTSDLSSSIAPDKMVNISSNAITVFECEGHGSNEGTVVAKVCKFCPSRYSELSSYASSHMFTGMLSVDLGNYPFRARAFINSNGYVNSRYMGSLPVPMGTKMFIYSSSGTSGLMKTSYKG
jgi:hypothetical protein